MKRFRNILIRLAAAALLIQIWCCAQFHKDEWEVASSRVPSAFDGFRITLLTDIHGTRFGKDSAQLLQAVASCAPDAIALGGDLVDRWSKEIQRLEPMLRGLCQIAPTYYVTGNHEWDRADTEALVDMVERCGVTVLRGSWVTLERDGQTVVLTGLDDPNGYADQTTPQELMEKIRGAVPGDPYIVTLYHRNTALELWSSLEADLVLSGHGHGGVVRLPIVGGLIGVDRDLFPDNCFGLHTKGRTTLAVSGGVAGVRVWNRPHIPTVVLKSVNNS